MEKKSFLIKMNKKEIDPKAERKASLSLADRLVLRVQAREKRLIRDRKAAERYGQFPACFK